MSFYYEGDLFSNKCGLACNKYTCGLNMVAHAYYNLQIRDIIDSRSL